MRPSRAQRRVLEAENKRWPLALRQIPEEEWPDGCFSLPRHRRPTEVWRSREFLVLVFAEADGIERLSINRTAFADERWVAGIQWDDLQRLKRECGRGGKEAVEIFPADEDLVNVANIRHLWVLPAKLPFGWRRGNPIVED